MPFWRHISYSDDIHCFNLHSHVFNQIIHYHITNQTFAMNL